MSAPRKTWLLHVRLLPGGDTDLWTAVMASGALAFVLWMVGGVIALIFHQMLRGRVDLGPAGVFSMSMSLPAGVLALWVGVRVARSKVLPQDEAGVDLRARRVFFWEDAVRVPLHAVLVPVKPRQVQVTLSDGRPLRLFFRANTVPDDMILLARQLRRAGDLALEDWVDQLARAYAKDTLPDPDGIKEGLGKELLEKGVILTRVELV